MQIYKEVSIMLAPSIFGMNDLFDDFGDVFEFSPAFRKQVAATRNISSDIKELADGYQIEMELPGFAKEEVLFSRKCPLSYSNREKLLFLPDSVDLIC